MEMGTIRTKVSRSHSEIIAFLSLTFCNPNPTYDSYTPPLKKCGYYIIPSIKKFALSVRLSVPHHFVPALYLEHFLTNFLQTLHNS